MAFENLFIRTEKFIGGIKLDAVVSEAHTTSVTKTKNPVELGADITDHAIIEGDKITIIAQVTDTPLGSQAVTELISSVSGLFGSSTSENLTRSISAYNAMVELQKLREPLEIQTKLKLYNNMLITNISEVQDKDTSRIVNMIIDLEEVIITESEIVQLDANSLLSGVTTEQASSAVNSGRQESITPSPPVESSTLKTIINWVGG